MFIECGRYIRQEMQHLQSIKKELEDATGKDVDVIDLEDHPDSEQLKGKGKKVY